MIARVFIWLDHPLVVPEGARFRLPCVQYKDYEITVRPPKRSDIINAIPSTQKFTVDGAPAFEADVLVFDFKKLDFDREIGSPFDPSLELITEVANWFIMRLRAVSRTAKINYIGFPPPQYRVEYLSDEGTELPSDPTKSAGFGVITKSISFVALSPNVMESFLELPLRFQLAPWRELQLEAFEVVPNMGAAFVLSFSSLELYFNAIVEKLCGRDESLKKVWEWLVGRDYTKAHSVPELADEWLRITLGKSLKDDLLLWQRFQELRAARNAFVHRGKLDGLDKPQERYERSMMLIRNATKVMDFVDSLLPNELREWKPTHEITVQVESMLLPGTKEKKTDE